ncbi:MAG TPA: hypothetical protein VMD48_11980 [Solirubrobacteraceae bacterium]|nr:hypothetical protein [Solirubrobacteraceae bacterium]
MPTRDQVNALLDEGHTYETAARELNIPAGLVSMIATGLPADGGESPNQQLVNPPPFTPTRKQDVIDWVRERAARELAKPS